MMGEETATEDWSEVCGANAGNMMPVAAWYPVVPFWPSNGEPAKRWRGGGGPSAFQGAMYANKQKHRFCATFPNVTRCRHGSSCAFAHSRDEITAPLLTEEEESYAPGALTEDFFTQRFKTLWCPIGAQHDWQACMYAHTYQDARRPPSIGYGHQLCPFWNKKDTSLAYAQRCPLGPRCPHAHGAKEQLYHPHYFRTLVCRDLQRGRCPRGELCAFFHNQGDSRRVGPDPVDYTAPLPKDDLPADWFNAFLNPPRFQEAASGEETAVAVQEMASMSAAPMFQAMPMANHGKWVGFQDGSHMQEGKVGGCGFEEDEETTADGLGAADDSEGSSDSRPVVQSTPALEVLPENDACNGGWSNGVEECCFMVPMPYESAGPIGMEGFDSMAYTQYMAYNYAPAASFGAQGGGMPSVADANKTNSAETPTYKGWP